MKKSSRIFLSAVILLVGFGLGYLCANLTTSEGNAKGDIAKVSKYSKNVVSPIASAFQEKIMNDPEEMERTKASLVILGSRMNDFDKLVDLSVKSCEGIDELKPAVEKLESIRKLSTNARKSANDAVESFNNMVSGEKNAAADYETASQNLSLAFLMVDRQMTVGKEFVAKIDSYLRGRNVEDNLQLALSRDLWAGYCAGEAILNGDEGELAYWTDKGGIVSPENISVLLGNSGAEGTVRNGEQFQGLVQDVGTMLGVLFNPEDKMGEFLGLVENSSKFDVMQNSGPGEGNLLNDIPFVKNGDGFAQFLNLKESMEVLQQNINVVNGEFVRNGEGPVVLSFVEAALRSTSVTDLVFNSGSTGSDIFE